MAQKKFSKITAEWIALSDIITVDADTTYYIQNRGPATIIALDTDVEPEADSDAGDLVLPYKTGEYSKGTGDLYLRAIDGTSSINITSKE